jgi:hypothetical protein
MMASTVDRSSCTSARASGELIHWLVPSSAAERPSIVEANFQMTNGRGSPAAAREVEVSQARLPAYTSAARSPSSTSIPCERSVSVPPVATGLGSATPATTRTMPARISAWVQGPVRPMWLHGSMVTTAVPPRARSPASASALTSACGPPA